jgi:hypothetical protein
VGAVPALRRQFVLPEDDVRFLDGRATPWEAAVLGGTQWLLIHGFTLPGGFSVPAVTVAIRIVAGYPAAALDMVYVSPPVARQDGKPIACLSITSLDGQQFQQWSRHYSPAHPWRADIDNIESHVRAAEEWFARAAQ